MAGEPAHTGGYGRALMRNNYLDFAPRVGLAYQLNRKTVVRSAYGIFYNSTFVQELQDMRKFWPYTIQQNFSANQGVLPDLKITDPGPSFQNTSAIGGWPQNPNNRTPYSEQWNLTVQRQLMDDMTLDVGYVGNVNKKQVGYDPINSAVTPASRTDSAAAPAAGFRRPRRRQQQIQLAVQLDAREPGEAIQQGAATERQLHLGPRHDQQLVAGRGDRPEPV